MTHTHRFITLAAVLASFGFGASRTWGADLTGVWLGQQQCDRFDGHKFITPFRDDVMVISQNGQDINMAALFHDGSFNLLFQGHLIDDNKQPDRKAQASFTECLTTPTSVYQEVGRATNVDLKKNEDGLFLATSIFFQLGDADFPTDTGTCRWIYKRVDTTDVGVPSCASVPSGLIQSSPAPRR